jgi:hypothetical protein
VRYQPRGDSEFKLRPANEKPVLQTNLSRRRQPADTDENPYTISHGTMVVSKAVGRKYGVAKAVSSCSESFFPYLVHWQITLSLAFLPTYQPDVGPNRADCSPSQATLVSVKMFPAAGNWENAMWEILNDIKAHPGREFRSAVTTGVAIDKFMTPAEAKADKEIQELYGDHLRELSALNVPFVTATGNGDSPDHPREVDQIPSVLQDDDMPLVVVGAADYEGHK